MYQKTFISPLGNMLATYDDDFLYNLEFVDNSCIHVSGKSAWIIELLQYELQKYFAGSVYEFTVPIVYLGTEFQKRILQYVRSIEFGATASYSEVARLANAGNAWRAAATAVAQNHIMVIIPCHRVIRSNGKIGNYSSGIKKKHWLLNHEKNFML
jgi:O-6-methylguanine DNA methyltransferase